MRAACRALKRRPYHDVRLLEDAHAGVHIGVVSEYAGIAADEQTGVLAAVDGEFVDGRVSSGDAAADELLQRYLTEGVELQPPDGWFAAAIWDPRVRAFCLVTDLAGRRPLYVARSGRRVLVAGELKALAAAGLRCEIDIVAWSQLLAYEFALGDRSPLAGAKLVPASSTLELPLGGGERLHRRWRFRLEPAPTGDERELAEELRRLTARAVDERLDDDSVLALSGGLDSRTMLAALLGGPHAPLLVSYGVPGSDDLRLAEAVAAAAGFPHRSLPLEPGYLTRGAEESVWLAEGSVRCLHAHHLELRRVRDTDAARAVLIGFAGDAVMRAYAWTPRAGAAKLPAGLHHNLAGCVSDDLIDKLLTPEFATRVRGLALDSLRSLVVEEEGDDVSRVRQFVWNHGLRRKVYPGALLFGDDLAPRDPFSDPEVIEFCRRIPERLRRDGLLQRASLDAFPQLTALPSPKDGPPPRLRGRRRRLSIGVVRAQRRSRARIDATLGFRWLPNRTGIGDYAHDLRTHGRPLLGLLLEPRTLARGQVREEGVRKLVDELLAGRRRNTRPLGMLLTLELFQRQFIDERPTVPTP